MTGLHRVTYPEAVVFREPRWRIVVGVGCLTFAVFEVVEVVALFVSDLEQFWLAIGIGVVGAGLTVILLARRPSLLVSPMGMVVHLLGPTWTGGWRGVDDFSAARIHAIGIRKVDVVTFESEVPIALGLRSEPSANGQPKLHIGHLPSRYGQKAHELADFLDHHCEAAFRG